MSPEKLEGGGHDGSSRGRMTIYLDNNATTPVHPRVAEVISGHLRGAGGNPSSDHAAGREAAAAVAEARDRLARLLGCDTDEIVFTGSGSGSNNLALKGVAYAQRERGRHIVISAIEHPAIEAPARYLEREGWEVSVVPVGGDGRTRPGDVARALRADTVLVSIMHSNNETGVLNPVVAIAALCRERGVLFHSDAAQSVGKIPVDVRAAGIDLLTVAGHKMGAPKGIGALYVRRGVALEPVIHGAGHEGGRRAGTENVPYIAGLGEACALALEEGLTAFAQGSHPLRDRLYGILAAGIPGLALNGHPYERLPNTLNVSLPGVSGRAVLAACPTVEASTGSACHEGVDRPSGVLLAMGLSPARALGALRLTLGHQTTAEDVERAGAALVAAVRAGSAEPPFSTRYSAFGGRVDVDHLDPAQVRRGLPTCRRSYAVWAVLQDMVVELGIVWAPQLAAGELGPDLPLEKALQMRPTFARNDAKRQPAPPPLEGRTYRLRLRLAGPGGYLLGQALDFSIFDVQCCSGTRSNPSWAKWRSRAKAVVSFSLRMTTKLTQSVIEYLLSGRSTNRRQAADSSATSG